MYVLLSPITTPLLSSDHFLPSSCRPALVGRLPPIKVQTYQQQMKEKEKQEENEKEKEKVNSVTLPYSVTLPRYLWEGEVRGDD